MVPRCLRPAERRGAGWGGVCDDHSPLLLLKLSRRLFHSCFHTRGGVGAGWGTSDPFLFGEFDANLLAFQQTGTFPPWLLSGKRGGGCLDDVFTTAGNARADTRYFHLLLAPGCPLWRVGGIIVIEASPHPFVQGGLDKVGGGGR